TSWGSVNVEVHFKSRGCYAEPVRPHCDRRVGSAHRPGQLGAPLLRAAWLADTDRAGRGTTALRRLHRRARGADSTPPGCRVHTWRGRVAVSGLGPQGSTMGPPRGI